MSPQNQLAHPTNSPSYKLPPYQLAPLLSPTWPDVFLSTRPLVWPPRFTKSPHFSGQHAHVFLPTHPTFLPTPPTFFTNSLHFYHQLDPRFYQLAPFLIPTQPGFTNLHHVHIPVHPTSITNLTHVFINSPHFPYQLAPRFFNNSPRVFFHKLVPR